MSGLQKRMAQAGVRAWTGLVLFALPLASSADSIEKALADVRDTNADIYSTQSSNFGELPGPAALAAAQVDYRARYRVSKPWKLDITDAKRRELEREYGFRSRAAAPRIQYHKVDGVQLGITGAWIKDELLRSEVTVMAIETGCPAEGALELDDVIIGAYGRLFEGVHDPRIPLGYALAEAQTERTGGVLNLQVIRKGSLMDVDIRLPVAVDYSPTWPYDCERSNELGDELVSFLLRHLTENPQRTEFWTELALMASGDHAGIEMVARRMRKLAARELPSDMSSWNAGYTLIQISEYYLLTGDTAILPYLQAVADIAERNQYETGTWSHGKPGGYGELNQVGATCFMGLALALQCGVEVGPDVMPKAIRFFGKFTGGGIPYGNHAGGPAGGGDNGTCGKAGLAFEFLGEKTVCERFVRPYCYSYLCREKAHGANFSYGLGTLALSRSPRPEFSMYMNNMLWHYEINRVRQGGMRVPSRFDWYNQSGMVGLTLYLPRKVLQLTGAPKSVFSMDVPVGMESAIDLYRQGKWKECNATLAAYRAQKGAGGSEALSRETLAYAKALAAKVDWQLEHAAAVADLGPCSAEPMPEIVKRRARPYKPALPVAWSTMLPPIEEAGRSYACKIVAAGTEFSGWAAPESSPDDWDTAQVAMVPQEGQEYYIRRTFNMGDVDWQHLSICTDNGAEIYLNGYKLGDLPVDITREQLKRRPRRVYLTSAAVGALRKGENVLTARMWGGQTLDLALDVAPAKPKPVPAATFAGLKRGLAEHWTLDRDGGGVRVVGRVKSDGVAVAPTFVDGRIGAALQLDDGKKAELMLAKPLGKGMTLSFWASGVGEVSSGEQVWTMKMAIAGRGVDALFGVSVGGSIEAQSARPLFGSPPETASVLNHWILTYDPVSRFAAVYLNGNLAGEQQMGESVLDLTTIVLSSQGGVFDDVYAWDRPLTDGEAAAVYNRGEAIDLEVK